MADYIVVVAVAIAFDEELVEVEGDVVVVDLPEHEYCEKHYCKKECASAV